MYYISMPFHTRTVDNYDALVFTFCTLICAIVCIHCRKKHRKYSITDHSLLLKNRYISSDDKGLIKRHGHLHTYFILAVNNCSSGDMETKSINFEAIDVDNDETSRYVTVQVCNEPSCNEAAQASSLNPSPMSELGTYTDLNEDSRQQQVQCIAIEA